MKFNENPFSGSQIVTWGQTDRQTDRHSNFQLQTRSNEIKGERWWDERNEGKNTT
jgi:hypothetical protein